MEPPTFREIVALLHRDGFEKLSQTGSHAKYGDGERVVIINGRGGDRPRKGTWANIKRQAGWRA